MWCGVVWCGVVWCGVVWCGVVWCGVVWCGVVWCGVVWCGVVWCGVVWCGVVWCGVVWCGVVWCGAVWCGVVWCGVVWGGVPFACYGRSGSRGTAVNASSSGGEGVRRGMHNFLCEDAHEICVVDVWDTSLIHEIRSERNSGMWSQCFIVLAWEPATEGYRCGPSASLCLPGNQPQRAAQRGCETGVIRTLDAWDIVLGHTPSTGMPQQTSTISGGSSNPPITSGTSAPLCPPQGLAPLWWSGTSAQLRPKGAAWPRTKSPVQNSEHTRSLISSSTTVPDDCPPPLKCRRVIPKYRRVKPKDRRVKRPWQTFVPLIVVCHFPKGRG